MSASEPISQMTPPMSLDWVDRRRWLQQAASCSLLVGLPALSEAQPLSPATPQTAAQPSPASAPQLIQPGRVLRFPHDHGAHPATRTEWWYLTGALQGRASASSPAQTYGFQITFFRSRVDVAAHSTSRFAARQLIFAHAS